MFFRNRAFTLIELLIVVAIIAILAAIAVPNFLEAQTRAKVSRVRADSRTVVTGLEAYAVDYNKYPVPRYSPQQTSGNKFSGAQFIPGGIHPVVGGQTGGLTSPISYLTSSKLKDIFAVGVFDEDRSDLFFQNLDIWTAPGPGVLEKEGASNPNILTDTTFRDVKYGSYKVGSLGPDKDYSAGANIYDPTNGSISSGDIYRSQKRAEGGGF
jgi:prepilin-type N-terminal cleavage/methylation domain-containing protein